MANHQRRGRERRNRRGRGREPRRRHLDALCAAGLPRLRRRIGAV